MVVGKDEARRRTRPRNSLPEMTDIMASRLARGQGGGCGDVAWIAKIWVLNPTQALPTRPRASYCVLWGHQDRGARRFGVAGGTMIHLRSQFATSSLRFQNGISRLFLLLGRSKADGFFGFAWCGDQAFNGRIHSGELLAMLFLLAFEVFDLAS